MNTASNNNRNISGKRHFVPSDCPPRHLSLDEEEALVFWMEVNRDQDHSDACAFLDASHVAVFDDCKRFLNRYAQTVIVVVNGTAGVHIFSLDDHKIELHHEFKPV